MYVYIIYVYVYIYVYIYIYTCIYENIHMHLDQFLPLLTLILHLPACRLAIVPKIMDKLFETNSSVHVK